MNSLKLFVLCLLGLLWCNYACEYKPYSHGEIMYQNFCASCHMEDGTGLTGNIPPLAGADFLRDHQEKLPCIIRYGIADTILVNGVSYSTPMVGVPQLTDAEVANIINYMNQAWGNDYGFVKPTDVERILKECRK